MSSPLSFSDTAIAFESRSNDDLKRAHMLFKAIGYNWLVQMGPGLVQLSYALRLPIEGIIRKTNSAMDDVGRASKDIADIVGKANRGEGTLGKIINDPTLYNDLLNGINTLRAGFEDIREQAPITTFATLLFQVFQ